MKKILLLLLLCVGMVGCQKEKDCNCGIIANDGITDGCYWLEVRSDCSGNIKRFCFDEDVWFNNYVGDPFCVTNQPGW
ncbi:MAG: hypothetical protein P8J32_04640 [bacterium]|nr:hypothetical protein [bacterium]